MGHPSAPADTLFDDAQPEPRPDRRPARRAVLGGALQLLRLSRGWGANDAASATGIAPMTWRRLEDGLEVRRRSLAAVDKLLGLPPGGTERAIGDDLLMLELAGRAGVDVSHVEGGDVAAFIDQLADRHHTGTVHQRTGGAMARAVGGAIYNTAVAPHVAAAQAVLPPTDLELVNRVLEQLTRSTVQTPAIRALIQAAAHAVPDLIEQQLAEVEREQAAEADPPMARAS